MSIRPRRRGLAVQVLTAVLSDGQALDEALERLAAKTAPEDRAWLTEVCSGVLRWKGRLDLAIDSAALRKKPSGWLRKILLLGAYQLVAQDRVPPAIVVSETVSEVKKREGEAPARFANALLRKIADTSRAWRELEFRSDAPEAEQAAWASLPAWFWRRLLSQHGTEWARRFSECSLERPKLWLRVAGESLPRAAEGGAVTEMAGFAEGRFFIQDASSQLLVAEISATVKERVDSAHPSALDLCSAPGGKAMGLAWNGFRVTATDIDPNRLARVRENERRVADTIRQAAGSLQIAERSEIGSGSYDLVWVDAPCTGSGIIRRHPDVRWLRKERDIESLSAVQLELVREAWDRVRKGGFLAYSVCSVFLEEGPAILEQAGLKSPVIRSWFLGPQEEPHGDGFWAALVYKA